MAATIASAKSAGGHASRISEQEAAQRFQSLRSELQGIATKIGELESDAEEHKAVIETLRQTQAKSPDRKCFRMIGGVLVERTVKDVLPALETNMKGLQAVIESLAKQYKSKDEEMQVLRKQHGGGQ